MGADDGARPRLAVHGGHEDAWAVGGGDHRADARPGRHLGGRQLGRHTAAAPHGAGGARDPLELMVDLDDLLDERSVLVESRIGGQEAGRVGEHHEHVSVDQVGINAITCLVSSG